MVKKKAPKKKSRNNPLQNTPSWAMKPFVESVKYIENMHRIIYLAKRGIAMLPIIEKLMVKLDAREQSDISGKNFAEDAQLAQKEVDNGFPLLYAQTTVFLWGSLESYIRNFLASWVANEPKAMFISQVQKLRIQLGEYESLSKEERPYYILDLLERDLQSPLKHGVTRFETLLEIFGMGGAVDETIRKDLFELNQIRNVIVHRQSVADKRLISACPWLNLKIGEAIIVSYENYERYSDAVQMYLLELLTRINVYFGVSREAYTKALNDKARERGLSPPKIR